MHGMFTDISPVKLGMPIYGVICCACTIYVEGSKATRDVTAMLY